jgi:protein SCO1
MPPIRMIGDDGRSFDLPSRLGGRITLMQLMFTGCSATCPIQGAVFSGVLPRLPQGTQLLSVSIDALNDDPKALRAWLRRFGDDPRWRAAVPARVADVDLLFDLLSGRARGPDPHTANVYLIDRQARLIFKTAEMPPAEELVTLLQQALARA